MKNKSRNIPVTGRKTETEFDMPNTFEHLFEVSLWNIYDAEQQLTDAFMDFAEAAENQELKETFLSHLELTKRHAERIEKIFFRLNLEKENISCESMYGLIEEAKENINDFEEGPVRDAALIMSVQKIEHYEIATYGCLCEMANVLGLNKTKEILGRSLEEEKDMDEFLSDLAQDINDEACEISEMEDVY